MVAIRPIFDTTSGNSVPNIALVLGNLISDTLYTRLANTYTYSLKLGVLSESTVAYNNNLYTYAGNSALSDVIVNNVSICEVMGNSLHTSEKDLTTTISNKSVVIENGVVASSTPAITAQTSAMKPTILLNVADQLNEYVPAPVIMIELPKGPLQVARGWLLLIFTADTSNGPKQSL